MSQQMMMEPPESQSPESQSPESDSETRVSVGEEFNRTLEKLLPWMVSVLMHMAVLLIAFFLLWSAGSTAVEEDNLTMILSPTQKFDPLDDTYKLDTATAALVPQVQTTPPPEGDPDALKVVAIESQAHMRFTDLRSHAIDKLGVPKGRDKGVIFDGTGDGPGGGDARAIVYCVDASGSMVDSFAYVINDLKAAIRRLSPEQRFTVIFFQAGAALEVPVPQRGYKRATEANMKLVCDWISTEAGHVIPRGSTDPVNAVKMALGYQPQLMYLLSDNITGHGRYQVNQQDLLALIDRTQHSRPMKTRINTIQFLYPDPLGTLRLIAEENGGKLKFVDESLMKPRSMRRNVSAD